TRADTTTDVVDMSNTVTAETAIDTTAGNTATAAAAAPRSPDPFDLDSLRLDPAFEEAAGVRKVVSTVPVRKPHDQEWVRVHPDPAYRGNFSCIKLKEDGEFFLLTPAIARDF